MYICTTYVERSSVQVICSDVWMYKNVWNFVKICINHSFLFLFSLVFIFKWPISRICKEWWGERELKRRNFRDRFCFVYTLPTVTWSVLIKKWPWSCQRKRDSSKHFWSCILNSFYSMILLNGILLHTRTLINHSQIKGH